MLSAIASEQPLVVLLDDLQWADAASCSLLFHIGRQLNGKRVLVVGAYRAEDLTLGEGRHPLQPVIRELQAQFGDNLIDLAGADHQAFVDAYLDVEPNRFSKDFRDTLYRRTEGHPLFTVELLRNLQTEKGLVRDEDGKWITGANLDWRIYPRELSRLSENGLNGYLGLPSGFCRQQVCRAMVSMPKCWQRFWIKVLWK